jgi:FAD/FMN-containing dehydrogenase
VPGEDEYNDRVDSYFSVTAQLEPKCFVLPRNTAEVSDVLKTLVQRTQCKFAVRSGGHSAAPGANNIEDGVTIDLSKYFVNPFPRI